eukprot:m.93205 g.93205  ORF g.93205 m.93205 type:complete len:332 (+) comp13389_c0_seq1:176-1171(+)
MSELMQRHPSESLPSSPHTCSPTLRSRVLKNKKSGKWLRKAMAPISFRSSSNARGGTNKQQKKQSLPSGQKKWLHTDDKICQGVAFKLKYIGSSELSYIPAEGAKNQLKAIKTCRATMRRISRLLPQTANLCVSSGKMTLTSAENNPKIIMRHSTCRVAFSTVDPNNPSWFCYVALVKGSDIALCHTFLCKSEAQGLELTFTCAQAFDYNYRAWVQKQSDDLDSSVFEPTIEPDSLAYISSKENDNPTQSGKAKKHIINMDDILEMSRAKSPMDSEYLQIMAKQDGEQENENLDGYMEIMPEIEAILDEDDDEIVVDTEGQYIDVYPGVEA